MNLATLTPLPEAATAPAAGPFQFQVLPFDEVPWARLDAYADRTIFQTRPWLEFLRASQGVRPVVVAIRCGDQEVGFFTGALFEKFGIRILGSSFPGWTTAHMGFNLESGWDRGVVAQELIQFALSRMGCWHVEIYDAQLRFEQVQARFPNARYKVTPGWVTDLRGTEDEVFRRMSENRRRCIKRAMKAGLVVEAASDPQFVEDYYDQLIDVFERQGLVPTYGKERVEALIRHLLPTGCLLLVRVRDPRTGRCVGCGLFPAFNGTMYFWGGAAYRADLHLHPNESMHWFAIRYWRERGVTHYDMMGGGDYKSRYGGIYTEAHWIRVSRLGVVMALRDRAQGLMAKVQRLRGWARHREDADDAPEAGTSPAYHLEELPDLDHYGGLLAGMPAWSLFQTPEWLRFLDESRPGQGVLLALKQGRETVGLLPGRLQRVGPVRIFASPFPGWTTPHMGPALKPGVPVEAFFEALEAWLRRRQVHHCELISPNLHPQTRRGWSVEPSVTYLAPLQADPQAMLAGYTKSCRKTIRQAQNKGVVVEFTDDPAFIDVYYQQLQAVFAKHKMVPTYPKARIEGLWRHLKPSGRLLTAWAKVDGQVVATRIDMVGNGVLHAFGSASDQTRLHAFPNEILRHHVMAWAGQNGCDSYDLCGGGYYKHKFNAAPVQWARLIYSPPWLRLVRNLMRKAVYLRNALSFRSGAGVIEE